MRFLRDNSNIILKLFINQVGVGIFSFFLYTIAGAIQPDGSEGIALLIKVIISLVSIWFYYTLIYLAAWEVGAKDKIRIDAGRAEKKLSKGFLLGFFANVINFVIWGLATLFIFLFIKGAGNAFFDIFGVINAIFRVICCMYLGIAQLVSSPFVSDVNIYYLSQSIAFFALPIIAVGVTFLAYFMGVNEKKIFPSAKNPKH